LGDRLTPQPGRIASGREDEKSALDAIDNTWRSQNTPKSRISLHRTNISIQTLDIAIFVPIISIVRCNKIQEKRFLPKAISI
jgi:hypothetical protein